MPSPRNTDTRQCQWKLEPLTEDQIKKCRKSVTYDTLADQLERQKKDETALIKFIQNPDQQQRSEEEKDLLSRMLARLKFSIKTIEGQLDDIRIKQLGEPRVSLVLRELHCRT